MLTLITSGADGGAGVVAEPERLPLSDAIARHKAAWLAYSAENKRHDKAERAVLRAPEWTRPSVEAAIGWPEIEADYHAAQDAEWKARELVAYAVCKDDGETWLKLAYAAWLEVASWREMPSMENDYGAALLALLDALKSRGIDFDVALAGPAETTVPACPGTGPLPA